MSLALKIFNLPITLSTSCSVVGLRKIDLGFMDDVNRLEKLVLLICVASSLGLSTKKSLKLFAIYLGSRMVLPFIETV
jgi:hypothetical protein